MWTSVGVRRRFPRNRQASNAKYCGIPLLISTTGISPDHFGCLCVVFFFCMVFAFEFQRFFFVSFSLIWHPMGVKNLNLYCCSFDSFSNIFFFFFLVNVPCDIPHISCFLGILKFQFYFSKHRNVTLWPRENEKLQISWEWLIIDRNRLKSGTQGSSSTTL